MKQVAIVGGGISGLAAAYYLQRFGIGCKLYEPQERLGGTIRTDRVAGCLVEGGADSWLAEKTWFRELLRDLGLDDQVIGSNDERRRTYMARRGRLVPLPEGLGLLAPTKTWALVSSPLFGTGTKLRFMLEWLYRPARRADRSVAEFVRDHFGKKAVEYLAQPMMAGVYGAPAESLSAERVLPRLVEYERRYGSIQRGAKRDRAGRSDGPSFLTLREGMGSLVETLGQRIAKSCEVVRSRVVQLRRDPDNWFLRLEDGSAVAEHVVVATPAHEAARLLAQTAPELADLLGRVGYTSSIVVGLVYDAEGFGHPLDGFGLLAPRAEQRSVAACTWVNTKFDGRTPPDRVLLRAFLTGEAAEQAAGISDESILGQTDADLRAWMRFRARPTGRYVQRWDRAMPQYGVGHSDCLKEIEEQLWYLPRLHLAGNGYEGLGIPDCVRRSEAIAEAISRS